MSKTDRVKPITTWRQALPNGGSEGVVAIYGHRRKGKTGTAWWRAEVAHEQGMPVVAYGFPKAARNLLPKWVIFVDNLRELAKLQGHFIVVDELALQAHARDHQSDSNKEWAKLIAVCGQCHHFLVLICQHTRQPDVALAMDPDIVIMKQPSHLHIRFARPELRPEVQEAWERFQDVRGDARGWCFVVDYHSLGKGMLRSQLPSFWSEELSVAFARYELVSLLRGDDNNGAVPNRRNRHRRGGRVEVYR